MFRSITQDPLVLLKFYCHFFNFSDNSLHDAFIAFHNSIQGHSQTFQNEGRQGGFREG